MVLLALISMVFAGLAVWRPRWWTLLVPFAFYLALAWLEQRGVLPGYTSYASAIFAGAIGAAFAVLGLLFGRVLRRRPMV